MESKGKKYEGDGIDVFFNPSLCIHAAECVRGLPGVFEPSRRPWIDATQAHADEIAVVIQRCPSGALTYERHDGGMPEARPPLEVRLAENGPIFMRGQLHLRDADGQTIYEGARVALCRCGASKRKPFCDRSHLESGFSAAAVELLSLSSDQNPPTQ
jgi:uncharacterized Fe-S cluster protein YjdI/CDGSH-type Zn-finger protein